MGYLILLLAVCGPVGWSLLLIWLFCELITQAVNYIFKTNHNKHNKEVNKAAKRELEKRGYEFKKDSIKIDRYP